MAFQLEIHRQPALNTNCTKNLFQQVFGRCRQHAEWLGSSCALLLGQLPRSALLALTPGKRSHQKPLPTSRSFWWRRVTRVCVCSVVTASVSLWLNLMHVLICALLPPSAQCLSTALLWHRDTLHWGARLADDIWVFGALQQRCQKEMSAPLLNSWMQSPD